MAVTRQPSPRSESTRWLPMKPAAPVTSACFMSKLFGDPPWPEVAPPETISRRRRLLLTCHRTTSGDLRNRDEATLDGGQRELDAVRHLQFVENLAQVILDRLLVQPEPPRDVLVAGTGHDQRDDLVLARCEAAGVCAGSNRVAQRVDQLADGIAPHPVLAAIDLTNTFCQEIRSGVLEQYAPGTADQCRPHLTALDRCGQQHRARLH